MPPWFWVFSWTGLMLGLVKSLTVPSAPHGPHLICWQAIIKCQSEPECHYAYTQYIQACAPVIEGHKKKCPSHCVASIVQLNLTSSGPGLENCDCVSDSVCVKAKRAIEPCVPRISRTGCTESRRVCEVDTECAATMRDYLFHCRQLFGGQRCTDDCRFVIQRMRSIPKARLLDTCECDGPDRTICEHVKVSMLNLCSGTPDDRNVASGFSDDEDETDGDYTPDDYDEQNAAAGWNVHTAASAAVAMVLTATFL